MKTEKVKLVERKSSEFLNQDSEQKEALKLTDQIKTGDVKNETQVVANDSEHLKLSAAQKYTEKYQAYLQRRKIYLKEYRQRQKIKDPPEKVEARRLDNIEKQRQYREETKRQKECGQIRKPEDTPEKKEARRLKKNYKNRQYRLRLKQKIDQSKTGLNSEKGGLNNSKKNTYKAKQRFNSLTPEQQEAFRIKRNKRQQRYRDQDKSILKKSLKLLKEKRELSAEEREVLILAEKIKKLKSKVLERRKQRLKEKRNALIKETITHRQNNTKGAGSLMTNHQPTSSFPPIVEDEIEIEKKVIQQNLIKAIPKRLTETLNDSSCSWLQPSQESFSTDGTHTFHGDSTISKSFLDGSSSHHSNKIERRKTVIDESFSCMRAVIDATAKGDRFVMFGKHIAQKIRSHKKGEAEINIAKLLIDNVLQNLSIGIYKSEF